MGRITIAIFARKKGLLKYFVLAVALVIILYYGYYHLTTLLGSRAVLTTGAAIILDAGHGGIDPGTHDGELKEKDIVLDVVLRMRDFLEGQGLRVDLTRDTDVDLGGELRRGRHQKDLEARLQLIKRGRVAVSIHCNSSTDKKQKGAVVFYQKDLKEGKKLADAVLQEVGQVQVLNHSFSVARQNLFLLRKAGIPVVLVEIGFLSNPEDKQKLQDKNFRQQLAEAVSKGIMDYLFGGQQ
ncbi:MAG TPA: N-acetylmuramoyl-L-alanine amidase [Clostridia bacterium]|nr:N-acetylmuramoyl-L-alanine amidase [Clostridia bacterium]